MALPTIPMSRVRLAGQAPRIALMVACGTITAGGAVRTFAPRPVATVAASAHHQADTTEEEGLAERFAVAYLSLDPGDDDGRGRRLRSLGLADTAALAERVGTERQTVSAVSTAAVQRVPGGVDVTVAAGDGHTWRYLLVPVRRDADGLSIAGPPALVGPPRVAQNALGRPEDEVQAGALKQVAERVVRHFVAGDRTDLVADLAPGVATSPPRTELRVVTVQSVTWVRSPGRVAAVVRARGRAGLNLTLRYELAVVRRDGRWLVTAIGANPTHEEQPK
jgi:hypothetical protein